ncbi:MAG: hypothetical protein ACTTI5_03255 [Treponema sp.]
MIRKVLRIMQLLILFIGAEVLMPRCFVRDLKIKISAILSEMLCTLGKFLVTPHCR